MFKEDGNVIHFSAPKGESQSDIQSLQIYYMENQEGAGRSCCGDADDV